MGCRCLPARLLQTLLRDPEHAAGSQNPFFSLSSRPHPGAVGQPHSICGFPFLHFFLLKEWIATFWGVMDFSEIPTKAMDLFLRRMRILWTYVHNHLQGISGLVEALGKEPWL